MDIIAIEEKAFEVMKMHFENFVNEIRQLCETSKIKEEWMDNQDVCMILKISKRTLQHYRDNRIIPYSRIGSKCYYKVSDIEKILSESEIN
jgi:hypothetical protein